MNFNYDKSWEHLLKIFKSQLPVNEAWIKFIEFHEKNAPKTYWAKLKSFDLAAEQVLLKDWMEDIVKRSPLPDAVVALWLGLVKFKKEDKEMYAIYLSGATTYTKNDTDWLADLSYLPEDRYAVPGILNELHEIIQKDKTDYEFLDWILPVAYNAFMLDELIRTSLDKTLFLKHKPELFFATGHD